MDPLDFPATDSQNCEDSIEENAKAQCSLLLKYINPAKLLALTPEESMSLQENLNEALGYNLIKPVTISHILCDYCSLKIARTMLSCGDKICKSCIKVFCQQYFNHENHLSNLDFYQQITKVQCSACYSYYTENDFRIFIENYENFKETIRIEEIITSLQENQQFFCINCKKNRSSYMFYSKACYHMCKICVCQNFYDRNFKCVLCEHKYESTLLAYEKYPCCVNQCEGRNQ